MIGWTVIIKKKDVIWYLIDGSVTCLKIRLIQHRSSEAWRKFMIIGYCLLPNVSSFLCCLLCYFSIFEPPGKQKKEGLHPGWLILNNGYNHVPGFTCSPIWTEHWLCFLIFFNMWVVASTLTLIGCSLIFLIKTLFIYTPYTSDCSHLECFPFLFLVVWFLLVTNVLLLLYSSKLSKTVASLSHPNDSLLFHLC